MARAFFVSATSLGSADGAALGRPSIDPMWHRRCRDRKDPIHCREPYKTAPHRNFEVLAGVVGQNTLFHRHPIAQPPIQSRYEMARPQNIYDNARFYDGYEELRRSGTGLNDVLEQPAIHSLLPQSLDGLHLLDIGCGFGDFARFARKHGAESVVGIDPSSNMIREARARTKDSAISYENIAVEVFEPELARKFDYVISSLALHYVEDYKATLDKVASWLPPEGKLIFSVEHPICTALAAQKWVQDGDGNSLYWPLDNYRDEGRRETKWFVDGVIKYHRTIESYVNGLLDTGFNLTRLLEPEPLEDGEDGRWANHRRRPPFLIIAAEKR